MITYAEYNARLCDKDLQEFFQYLLMARLENPADETVKDTIAELQGLAISNKLDGKTIIELREQSKIAADLAEQGKLEDSLFQIQHILEAYPEHYSAYYTLGMVSFEQGNFSEALGCFKQAFDYNQFFVDAVLRIFDCCVCLGNVSEVDEYLSRALLLQKEDPELLETKTHLEHGTYPERLIKYLETPEEKQRRELLKVKEMLESGDSDSALEKLKALI